MTAFWINLPDSVDRREHMISTLSLHGFKHHHRIEAWTPQSVNFKQQVQILAKPCKRNTDTDVAVIASHMRAIHTAIYHDPQPHSPYALILEDDIRFLFAINFTALITSAPQDFAILQLTTSNAEALDFLWGRYSQGDQWYPVHWRNSTRNGKTYLFWSAQGYLIQKAVMKSMLDDIIEMNAEKEITAYKISNSFYPERCRRPCVLAFCLFSDTYIYSLGKPTYVTTLSMITGARIGWNSTIHPLEVNSHRSGFSKMRSLAHQFRSSTGNSSVAIEGALRLPAYLTPWSSCRH
eukprot:gene5233-5764_t